MILVCLIVDINNLDVLAFPLLRWVVSSNRSHLKKLEKNEMVSQMNTTHQYLLMSSTPEKEKRFQALKKKHGSFYACKCFDDF
jgi:poly [ADP-ribose] polymerase 6/8